MSSGDTLVSWRALDNEPPIDEFATFETLLAIQVGLNDPVFPILVFPDAVHRYGVFGAVMPAHYAGGGISVELVWMSPATSGNCRWIVSFKRVEDGVTNMSNLFFGPQTQISATTNGTAHVVDYDTLLVSDGANMQGILAGEYFYMELFRDGITGLDTMTDDARLISIIISEQ